MNETIKITSPFSGNYAILIAFLAVYFSFSASAQSNRQDTLDYRMNPTYGEITLDDDFGSEVHSIKLTSGGNINSSYLGGECTGFVSKEPDYRLFWNNTQTSNLGILFTPDDEGEDPTILVNLPDGTWICNDDMGAGLLLPFALIENPKEGQYDIWVGSFDEGNYIEGTLVIADMDRLLAEDQSSLDFNLDPHYSTISLNEGFSPDPFVISGTSGGDVDIRSLSLGGNDCIGFASDAPDFRINWSGSTSSLVIRFEAAASGDDTILIINTPDGSWICNDDADELTLNPMIRLNGYGEGQYDIWVASMTKDSYIDGKLIVTER
jgi:hypothetical protein